MNISLLNALLVGAALAAAIRAAGAMRLHTLVRAYSASALFLGLFVVGLGIIRQQPELYWLAATAVILKVIIIPAVINRAAERSTMSMRLSSSLRPATTYLTVMALTAIIMFVALRSPFAAAQGSSYLLLAAVAMVMIGFSMMIMRRDLMSQVIGFLVMENGISAFSFAVVRDLPFLVELGILMTLTVGIVIMGTVSARIRELYGTENTQALRELTD
jgi:hydrogenase-4 component E